MTEQSTHQTCLQLSKQIHSYGILQNIKESLASSPFKKSISSAHLFFLITMLIWLPRILETTPIHLQSIINENFEQHIENRRIFNHKNGSKRWKESSSTIRIEIVRFTASHIQYDLLSFASSFGVGDVFMLVKKKKRLFFSSSFFLQGVQVLLVDYFAV